MHGQIVLQLFKEYPSESIRRCQFVCGLEDRMRLRSHSELKVSKQKQAVAVPKSGAGGARNANPAGERPGASVTGFEY